MKVELCDLCILDGKVVVAGTVMRLKNSQKKVKIDICSRHPKAEADPFIKRLLHDDQFFVETEAKKIHNVSKILAKDREKFKANY